VIAALDVGTTKVACFIARQEPGGDLRVIGIGQEIADGLRAGVVTDMEAAEHAIRTAVHRAETMADEHVRDVFVSISGGAPSSSTAAVRLGVAGHAISENDIQKAFDEAAASSADGERDIVHAIPTAFDLDGSKGIRDPRGMYGDQLGVRLHMVTVTHGSLRNLLGCISRCGLEASAPVVSVYAAGLACLVADEMDLGVTFIDMGGGTTSIAVFFDGNLIWTATVPLGGAHVTNDIARGLSTPIASAERMKRLYASTLSGPADDRETIEVPELGDGDRHAGERQIQRSLLTGIVRPRLEEILELVRDRIETSGVAEFAGRRVVLSGGASQLQGMSELASNVLDKQIRLATPLAIPGLAQAVAGPEFAACAGLLLFANRKHGEPRNARRRSRALPLNGPFGKIGQWLRENF